MAGSNGTSPLDAVVIGGGPAGSAVARHLALLGHEVVVLSGPAPRRLCIAESLPPSCRKPLAALGLLDKVESAGFLQTRGNTAAWAGPELRAQDFGSGETGFQVVRHRLDDLLLASAHDAGARIIPGAVARAVHLGAGTAGEPLSRVCWAGPAGNGELSARWVLDCSGRSGALARRGFRRREPGPATTALIGVWRSERSWPSVDPSHTVIESYRDGWVWSVPVEPGRRFVAAMIDPRLTGTTHAAGLDGMYLAELGKTRHVRRMLEGATAEGAVWACAATRYGATQHGGNGFLLVGDAGCFLDPLSSFGVKKALASGYLAATVAHTCLTRPDMREAALRLFGQRERAANVGYAALATRHYSLAATWHQHPFWQARAAAASVDESPPDDTLLARYNDRVVRAFDSLRSAPALQLRPTPNLRRIHQPTVEGCEVVLREHLATPDFPAGIRFVRGVDLPALVDVAPRCGQVPDLHAEYGRTHGPVDLPNFLGALSTLLALGMLDNQSQT